MVSEVYTSLLDFLNFKPIGFSPTMLEFIHVLKVLLHGLHKCYCLKILTLHVNFIKPPNQNVMM